MGETGKITIIANNIKGNAKGKVQYDANKISNTSGGVFTQNGKQSGLNHEANKAPKAAVGIKIIKLEGPFDDEGKLVKNVKTGEFYTFKATPSRKPIAVEIPSLKWAIKPDDKEQYQVNGAGIYNRLIEDKIVIKLRIPQVEEKVKVYAFYNKPNESVSIELKVEIGEILLISGTEQHSQTYGNKLMFPAQAVREVRQNYKDHKHVTIIIFKDAFTDMQLSIIKKDAKEWNKTLYFKKINSTEELIKYINDGDATVNRKNIKIETIKVFSHGLPSVLDFGLDGDNENHQRFRIADVSKLKNESFVKKPTIYSYACRTGNTDDRAVTLNPSYKYDSESIKLVKPKESLAQKFSDHLDAKVFAFLRRSNYTSSWLDGGDKKYTKNYITIEDEEVSNPINPRDWFRTGWDESLWNKQGAFLPPTSGNSPGGLLPEGIFIFEKGLEPKKY